MKQNRNILREETDRCQRGGGLWRWVKKVKGLSKKRKKEKKKNSQTQTTVPPLSPDGKGVGGGRKG